MGTHRYIDTALLRNYKGGLKKREVYNDLFKYHIQNIRDIDDEAHYEIADALYKDFQIRRANYKAYIEDGMDLRMLMELRKSAVLPISRSDYYFFEQHKYADTPADVKKIRNDYFQQINTDYADEDWQHMAIVSCFLGKRAKGYYCDYTDCFADGYPFKVKGLKDYKREFLYAHFQGFMGLDYSPNPDEEDDYY